jgi:hypothetical protein
MNHHFRSVFGTSIPNTRAVPRLLLFSLMASLVLVLVPTADAQTTLTFIPNPLKNPICSKIGKQIQVSLGLRMFCFGPQPNGPGTGTSPTTTQSSSGTTSYSTSIFSPNVNAASLAEDITPSSTRAYGQSETSIAASGSYVVEAWNDATGFVSPCPSPMYKEELTGAGFSKDGGNTFTDLGGLPNNDCANNRLSGDPSVEVFHAPNGTTYFYISSLYLPQGFADPTSKLALNVCTVSGSGTLSCGQPVIAAKSSECLSSCSFLDKEFLTIDPVNKRLYMSYTEFGFSPATANGQIELATCDLTNPATPVCENGSNGPSMLPASPYLVVAPSDANCEQEGAYPAVDRMTGDVYVAWEFNWATNALTGPPCNSTPTRNVLAYVAFNPCLGPAGPPAQTSSCAAPQPSTSVPITSMDLAFIPGYSRFPMNDFPRIAVSDPAGTVSIVWNDAGSNPGGDILLQSFNLGSSFTPTGAPVKINNDNASGTFHFLPALRNADSNGKISISWYDRRRNPNTALTDVFAAVAISPRITSTPTFNQRVTDTASNWSSVSSDINPNFGDYTDNYASPPPPALPPEDDPLFVAWSDGRLNVPQPFESHAPLPAPPAPH